jgi:hydroxymethylpyrimidine/phosphomethylpyrimidine kinase
VADGWTIAEAVHHLHPAISRRDLARVLADVEPSGFRHGMLGRRAKLYPIDEILRRHADWARERFFSADDP